MHRPQQQVSEFHKIIEAPTSPAPVEMRNAELRAKLILEEALETAEALVGTHKAMFLARELELPRYKRYMAPSLTEAIDGICDTIVVCYGTAEDIGIDLEPFFDEVMRANMAKIGGPLREDGKRLKPPGWTPPDIEGVLARVTR
jgi:predicted HAD superfamily Cof-like phosphohydrolase